MSGRALDAKGQAVVAEIVALIEQGFTGSFELHLKDGVPQLRKRTDTLRYGKPE